SCINTYIIYNMLLFLFSLPRRQHSIYTLLPYTTLFRSLLEGTLQASTSAVSDKLLDLVGLGGKSAADKGKDTRDYLAAAFPELRSEERFSRNAETDLVCRLLLEKKNKYLSNNIMYYSS